MKQGAFCLFIILTAMAYNKAGAQRAISSTVQPLNPIVVKQGTPTVSGLKHPSITSLLKQENMLGRSSKQAIVPSNYYVGQLGFFCSKELQIEKATKFPLRFRLGSVQYTDKLEGKNAGSNALH